jgi:hypothetical protein
MLIQTRFCILKCYNFIQQPVLVHQWFLVRNKQCARQRGDDLAQAPTRERIQYFGQYIPLLDLIPGFLQAVEYARLVGKNGADVVVGVQARSIALVVAMLYDPHFVQEAQDGGPGYLGRVDHQDFVARHQKSGLFQLHQVLHHLRAGKLLLHLLAPHGIHNGHRLLTRSKTKSLYLKLIAVGRFYAEKYLLCHAVVINSSKFKKCFSFAMVHTE